MNKLYEKIYEAVNAGIQKALIIDPEQDVSICWQDKKIQSNVNIMNHYVKELMAGNTDQYEYILKCNKETGQKYHIKNFNELIEIFKIIDKIPEQKNDLHWLQLSDILCLITYDNEEVSFDNADDYDIKFIKIKNNITGHDIILHKDLLISGIHNDKLEWNKTYVHQNFFNNIDCISCTKQPKLPLEEVKKIVVYDYDGYINTYNNINIENKQYMNYPAFKYCVSLNDKYPDYEVYLPAAGELHFIIDNIKIFNYILHEINSSIIERGDYWSSTEENYDAAWQICAGKLKKDDLISYDYKCHSCMVLPFFKKK